MTRRKFITLLGGTPKDGLAFGIRFRAGQTPCSRAAEQRDELAPFPLTEMHPIPLGPGAHHKDIGSGTRGIGEPLPTMRAAA
jgi:hypothetical protein